MNSHCVGRRMFYFNTVCEAVLYEYEGNPVSILQGCEEILSQVQKRLNIFDPSSELSLLNADYKPECPVPVSHELYMFLRRILLFSADCGGSYDPTVGPLVRLWNITAQSPKIPDEAEIRKVKEVCGFDKLVFKDIEQSITFLASGMEIDAGGAGKGYGAELIAAYLKKKGVCSASVNLGGNLYLLGQRITGQEREDWKVGIQSPWKDRGRSLGTLSVRDVGVATSAGYERYFEMNGKKYHHIVDPRTGWPAENELESVTIVSDLAIMTDLVSTAFFVLGLEKGDCLARKLRNNMFLEYVAVTHRGIEVSEGIKCRFQKNNSLI